MSKLFLSKLALFVLHDGICGSFHNKSTFLHPYCIVYYILKRKTWTKIVLVCFTKIIAEQPSLTKDEQPMYYLKENLISYHPLITISWFIFSIFERFRTFLSVSFSYSFFPSPLPVLLHPSPSFFSSVSPFHPFSLFPFFPSPDTFPSGFHPWSYLPYTPPPCCPLVHSKPFFLSPTPIHSHCLLLHLFSFILLTIHFKLFLFVLF